MELLVRQQLLWVWGYSTGVSMVQGLDVIMMFFLEVCGLLGGNGGRSPTDAVNTACKRMQALLLRHFVLKRPDTKARSDITQQVPTGMTTMTKSCKKNLDNPLTFKRSTLPISNTAAKPNVETTT